MTADRKLCTYCFDADHQFKNCPRSKPCEKCGSKAHYTRLCDQKVQIPKSVNSATISICGNNGSYLKIIRAMATGPLGGCAVTVFLDGGLSDSYVSNNLVRKLGLKDVCAKPISINTCTGKSEASKKYRFVLAATDNSASLIVDCYVHTIPAVNTAVDLLVSNACWQKGVDVYSGPGNEVPDVMIGTDLYNRLKDGVSVEICPNLEAHPTIYGWCLHGKPDLVAHKVTPKMVATNCATVADDLARLWEIEGLEDVGEEKDNLSLERFNKSTRLVGGRYEVCLPWRLSATEVGNSCGVAIGRLRNLKKQLQKKQQLTEYATTINDYLLNSYAEPAPKDIPAKFHMPHQPVYREDKETTKLRVVFDASCRTSGGLSLNQCLSTGVDLNPRIFDLLLNFRCGPVAVTADIEKAFLHIRVKPDNRKFLRFFWFNAGQIEEYQFTSVQFGTSASPFLLSATLKFHLDKLK